MTQRREPNYYLIDYGGSPPRTSIDVEARSRVDLAHLGNAYIMASLMEYLRDDPLEASGGIAPGFANYFACSFSNDPSFCSHGLSHALWEIRGKDGIDFTDQIVAEATRALHDDYAHQPIDKPVPIYRVIQNGCNDVVTGACPQFENFKAILRKNGVQE